MYYNYQLFLCQKLWSCQMGPSNMGSPVVIVHRITALTLRILNFTHSFSFHNNRLSKKSCGIFIEFSIVHKIGYNNAIYVLFDDEFPTRCQLHNAPLIEARFPIVKQLGELIFRGLSCGQLPTTKLVRHGQK